MQGFDFDQYADFDSFIEDLLGGFGGAGRTRGRTYTGRRSGFTEPTQAADTEAAIASNIFPIS